MNKEKPTLTRTIWAKAIELGFNLNESDAYDIGIAVSKYLSEVTETLRNSQNELAHIKSQLKFKEEENKALQAKINGNDIDSQDQEDNPPYLIKKSLDLNIKYSYNPDYGDDRICECGDSYYRHFDSYEEMEAVGCKYCECLEFKEDKNKTCSCEVGHPYQTAACPIHGTYKEDKL